MDRSAAGSLTKELRDKFHDLLVTRGGTVLDDEFKRDPLNREVLDQDPQIFHRQELHGHADEYERREELLDETLERISELGSVNLQDVYKILALAKRAKMNSRGAQSGIDRRRKFFTTRDELREEYIEKAYELRRFLQLADYPTTLLDPSGRQTERRTPLTRLLGETILEVFRDPTLNLERGNLPLRAAKAGRRAEPWLMRARKDLVKAGLPADRAEFLLISVGLIPDRVGDYR